jgi:hypothetical protein
MIYLSERICFLLARTINALGAMGNHQPVRQDE